MKYITIYLKSKTVFKSRDIDKKLPIYDIVFIV